MRVAIYVRVSTDKQEAENQLIQLREYCGRQGWNIEREYVDVVSGRETNRIQWNLMFQHAHQLKFDVLLFWSLDRFSRSGTLYTLQKFQELESLKIKWVSFSEPYISSLGVFGDVVVSILATLAKIEREAISRRTRAGLERVRRSGKKLGRKPGSKDRKKRRRKYWKKEE